MDFNDDFSYFSLVKASMDVNNETTTKHKTTTTTM